MKRTRNRGLPRYAGSGLLHGLLIPLTIIEVAAIIAQAFFLARAVTFLFKGTPIAEIWSDVGFFFLAFILRYMITHVQTMLAERFAAKTARMLRNELMRAYFGSHLFFIQQKGVGHLVTLTMDGVDQVKTYAEIISIRMIKTFIVPAVIGVYIFTLDVASAVILVVAVPILIMFMILLGKAAKAMADKQYETYKRLSNHFIDSLKGLETLVFLGRSKKHAEKINQVNTDYRTATMRTLKVAFLSSFALDFFGSLSIAFVAVGLGLRLIEGSVDLLPALTILILAPEYFAPIKQVGKDYHATLDGQVAMAEIDGLIADQGQNKNDLHQHTPLAELSEASSRLNATLAFDDVTVELNGNHLLNHMSFEMQKGWIGIIGPSGSGKSSLISVLAGRLQPTSGTIRIGDDERAALDFPEWFDQIAYIPQQPYIFPVSLADNIRFYAPDATDEQIEGIVGQIGLADFVKTLPNGIHEHIGEGGRMLSGGQEQRVAIARALLSDKPIILLDEPTAHLDVETEYEIKQVMRDVFAHKHVILATHRLHWMNEMDDIYMLDAGQIVDHGTHQALIEKQGAYYEFIHWKGGRKL
ncbi:thiol reductant ABC exporter subunit CydD [Lentibacillus saliphilus]|uniref:thiol reductant ABC exporter subunit CydD n=1 Tax=Lentibacillus saliphilus TaxID=2737028 RepID=UPI001C30F1D5|nr:thiol reductant ABC exporter subunit CydD [Lentibacillus saliphilus]